MDNLLIPILGVASVVLLGVIFFLMRKLKSNSNAIQYTADDTLPNIGAVIERVPETAQIDVAQEIQQYIDQGRLPQAVGLLNKAIASEPGRSDLRVMLLGIYAQQNDAEQFEQTVDALHALNDPMAIAQANDLRTTMMTSAEELPIEDMIAAQSAPVPKVDDGMIEFESTEVTLEDATGEVDAIDFDFEQTPEEQLAELETEVTATHLKAVTDDDVAASVDSTEEITFDFSAEPEAAVDAPVPASEEVSELSFDTLADAAPEAGVSDELPELTFDDVDVVTEVDLAEPSELVIDTPDEPVMVELELSTADITLDSVGNADQISPAPEADGVPVMVPDAVAVTSEFSFDLDKLDNQASDTDSAIDAALTSGQPSDVSLEQAVSVEETGTFNFDAAELAADAPAVTETLAPESDALSFGDTLELDAVQDDAVSNVTSDVPVSELTLEADIETDTADESISFSEFDTVDLETASTEESNIAIEPDLSTADTLAAADESSVRLTPLNDVVPESTSPDDTIAQLDAIFLEDIGASDTPEMTTNVTPAGVASGLVAAAGIAAATLDVDTGESAELSQPVDMPAPEVLQTESIEINTDDTIDLDAINDTSTSLTAITDDMLASTDSVDAGISDESGLSLSIDDVAEDSLDSGLTLETEEQSITTDTAPTAQPAAEVAAPVSAGSDDLLNQLKAEFSFVDTHDANKTNLELASRYIELGEHGSAKALLQEVVSAGSIEQQGEAKQLLEKVNA